MNLYNHIDYMELYLTENIQKYIAQFLTPEELTIKVNISQNAGCDHGSHNFDLWKNCENCNNFYEKSEIFVSVEKNTNHHFFQQYISELSKIIYDYDRPLKSRYSLWGDHFFKFRDLFKYDPEISKIDDNRFIIKGLKWLLFHLFLNEISDIRYFKVGAIKIKQTVLTSCYFTQVLGLKKRKNILCLINKNFYKYSFPNY